MSDVKASMDGRAARRRDLAIGWVCFGLRVGAVTTKTFDFKAKDMSVSFPGKTAQLAKIAWSA